jgi:hypothetical protein
VPASHFPALELWIQFGDRHHKNPINGYALEVKGIALEEFSIRAYNRDLVQTGEKVPGNLPGERDLQAASRDN